MRSAYRLHENLGGASVEVLHGMAPPDLRADLFDVRIHGTQDVFSISRKMVVRVQPEEPPDGSVVRVGGAVFQRKDSIVLPKGAKRRWLRAGGLSAVDWAHVLSVGVGVELLVPDPDDEP